jgi:hypothetical protein
MNMKKGLKTFGDAGVEAVLKELQQLHDRKVMEPKDTSTMSLDEKRAALQYLMFLKQKRNGTIKGRGCADVPMGESNASTPLRKMRVRQQWR